MPDETQHHTDIALKPRPVAKDRDVVYTPDWIVRDMLDHFHPSGVVLDPCRGLGAFHDQLPEGSPWCEISDGRDFFDWSEPVDWVIGNPPYSITRGWFRHSFTIAENLLYLVPVRNVTSAYGFLSEIGSFGGIVAVRLYGTGNRCGFPMGNAIAAIHVQRGYSGPTTWTDQQQVIRPAETQADYLLDGSPESVALVREARGLPPLNRPGQPVGEVDR